MTTAAATRPIAGVTSEGLWELLRAIERWPAWAAPVIGRAARGAEDGRWTVAGALGRIGYAGDFTLVEYAPPTRLYLESLTRSTPFESIIHELEIAPGAPPRLTWRAHYALGGGPGGWIIAGALTRRQLPGQLATALERLGAGS